MRRQLPYLCKIATNHLLVTVSLKILELKNLYQKPHYRRYLYKKQLRTKFIKKKGRIVKRIKSAWYLTVLTTPQQLNFKCIKQVS